MAPNQSRQCRKIYGDSRLASSVKIIHINKLFYEILRLSVSFLLEYTCYKLLCYPHENTKTLLQPYIDIL